jgi:hypothetical protein
MQRSLLYLLAILHVLTCSSQLHAQITLQEQPRSADAAIQTFLAKAPLKASPVSPLDRSRIESEDARFPGDRFAAPTAVDFDLANSGEWTEMPNGDRIWRLHVQASGAYGLGLFYDQFYLPPGARLHVYTPDRSHILGAYTQQNNSRTGRFLTGFLPGDEAIVEYFEPASVTGQGQIHLFRIDQVYKPGMFGNTTLRSNEQMELGFGASFDCHANINCPEGDNYQTLKKGIIRILVVVEEGSGFCTGNLLNNTRQDNTPYVLSAFHCQDGFTPLFDLWRFDFGYETNACANPNAEPSRQSILGCQKRAGRQENDFILLELFQTVPTSFDPYFLGWDRSEVLAPSATIIHHPRGDIKKIAFEEDAVRVFPNRINWNNDVQTPASHHFIVNYDFGAFEIGSSGSALLNPDGRVVGQLHGGTSDCESTTAYYGRLTLSWEGGGTPATRLRDWLDPDSTGAVILNGRIPDDEAGLTVSGMVHTETGTAIPNTQVILIGSNGSALSTFTDDQGLYTFTNVAAGITYEVSCQKSDMVLNGVNTLDLIQIQRHILNLVNLDSPYQLLSADVNASGSVSTLDLIIIRKVILGLEPDFSPWPSWYFVPAINGFANPQNPLEGFNDNAYLLENLQEDILDFDLIGFKPGDVNDSASF